jgi:predicted CXXCH cytochrome family protein
MNMRYLHFFLIIVFFFFYPACLLGKTRPPGITGSQHDFSWWNVAKTEICIVCHTPHNARTEVPNAPLWNHRVSQATYQLYSSSTLDGAVGQPDGVSKLCLGCHDGTVGLTGFGNNYPAGYINTTGTDLRDEHPVSFTYDTALSEQDSGLYAPATKDSGLGSTIAVDMLSEGKMHCNSCHDVHNRNGLEKLLIKSNAGEALCLTCHKK